MASVCSHIGGKNCGNNCEVMFRPLEFPPMSRMSDVLLFLGAMLAVITDALKDVDIVFPLILTCYDNLTACILTLRDSVNESENTKALVLSRNSTHNNATELTDELTHRIAKLNAIVVYLERCVNAVLYLNTEKRALKPLPHNDHNTEKCVMCKCDATQCKEIIGIATLNCGHHLCAECINSILVSKKCPGCNYDIENVQDLINSILEPLSIMLINGW